MLVFSSNSSAALDLSRYQSRHCQGLLAESGLLYPESGSDFKASGDLSAKGPASDRCRMIHERHWSCLLPQQATELLGKIRVYENDTNFNFIKWWGYRNVVMTMTVIRTMADDDKWHWEAFAMSICCVFLVSRAMIEPQKWRISLHRTCVFNDEWVYSHQHIYIYIGNICR